MAEMNSEWVSLSFYSSKYSEAMDKINQLEVNNPAAYTVELRNMKGLCFMRLGKPSEAKDVFDSVLALDPSNQEAMSNKTAAIDAAKHIKMDVGDKLFQKGQYQEALDAYNSIQIAPDDLLLRFQVTNNKGAVMMNMGRVDDAITAFNEALRLQPNNADTLHNKGTALKVLGRYDEALISYEECLRHEPDAYAALCGKCETLTSIGRFEEAEEAIDRAISKNADDHRGYADRGFARLKLQKYLLAISDFDDAMRRGDVSAECKKLLNLTLSLRGDQLSREGNHPEALRTYERALSVATDMNEAPNANLLFNHALSMLNSGNSTGATNGFRRVIQMKPDHFQAHNALGLVMMQTARWAEALESMTAAYKLNQDELDLQYNLGVVYLNLGQLERASRQFRDLLKKDPSNAMAQKALATVESQLSFHAAAESGSTSKMAEEVIARVAAERPPQPVVQPQPVAQPVAAVVAVVEEVKAPVRTGVIGSMTFPYAQLRAPGPYPDGINSDKRESHLSNEEFLSLFGVDKRTFETQPKWKQVAKKRDLLLF